ncbi:hypothetical protein E24_00160 [Faustovirus]|nr:hypothetical protein E24_00160 [Faustovirus]AMN85060.1 hypothetical protein E23_00159 [Faustovirus]
MLAATVVDRDLRHMTPIAAINTTIMMINQMAVLVILTLMILMMIMT